MFMNFICKKNYPCRWMKKEEKNLFELI